MPVPVPRPGPVLVPGTHPCTSVARPTPVAATCPPTSILHWPMPTTNPPRCLASPCPSFPGNMAPPLALCRPPPEPGFIAIVQGGTPGYYTTSKPHKQKLTDGPKRDETNLNRIEFGVRQLHQLHCPDRARDGRYVLVTVARSLPFNRPYLRGTPEPRFHSYTAGIFLHPRLSRIVDWSSAVLPHESPPPTIEAVIEYRDFGQVCSGNEV
jgi:hypothetical protein